MTELAYFNKTPLAEIYRDTADFTPLKQFRPPSPLLPKEVESDHAQIRLRLGDGKVFVAENFNNPAFVGYFGADNHPFRYTHLYHETPYLGSHLISQLLTRVKKQTARLLEDIANGTAHIYAVVEGFDLFYDLLSEVANTKLIALNDNKDCPLMDVTASVLILKQSVSSYKKNSIGLVVSCTTYKPVVARMIIEKYTEYGSEKTFNMPYLLLSSKEDENNIIVAAVHVSGCANQYPVAGLKKLAFHLAAIYERYQRKYDVIAMGDFNSAPTAVAATVITALNGLGIQAQLFRPRYRTHINPDCLSCAYDLCIQLGNSHDCSLYPVENISISSSLLSNSMESLDIFNDELLLRYESDTIWEKSEEFYSIN